MRTQGNTGQGEPARVEVPKEAAPQLKPLPATTPADKTPVLTGIRPHLELVNQIIGEALRHHEKLAEYSQSADLSLRLSYARGVMSMTLDALKDD